MMVRKEDGPMRRIACVFFALAIWGCTSNPVTAPDTTNAGTEGAVVEQETAAPAMQGTEAPSAAVRNRIVPGYYVGMIWWRHGEANDGLASLVMRLSDGHAEGRAFIWLGEDSESHTGYLLEEVPFREDVVWLSDSAFTITFPAKYGTFHLLGIMDSQFSYVSGPVTISGRTKHSYSWGCGRQTTQNEVLGPGNDVGKWLRWGWEDKPGNECPIRGGPNYRAGRKDTHPAPAESPASRSSASATVEQE